MANENVGMEQTPGYGPGYGQSYWGQSGYAQQPEYYAQGQGYAPPTYGGQSGATPPPAYVAQPVYTASPYGPNPYATPYGTPYAIPAARPDQAAGSAIAGLILGIISALAWIFPICGLPLAVGGIVFSVLGRKSPSRRTMATAGLVLAIIGLVLTLANAALGVMMALQSPTL